MSSKISAVVCAIAMVGLLTMSSGTAPAQPASPAPAAPATKPVATKPATKPAVAKPKPDNQFSSEDLAKAHCPGDTVVWVNLSSKIYHLSGTGDYGKTKKGAYMCEKETTAAGFRAAKNEKKKT
jgi:hypothetical protein